MDSIHFLDKSTIDKIAAGEVVDRPLSIVKELCENSIDAGASAISVEIEGGGIKLIRITDNGRGIASDQVKTAFLRHTTSKITDAQDLHFIKTLGFRGEALSSISAVSRLELFTKTKDSLTGILYKMEGGNEVCFEEAGLPDGTTIVVKDLFFNTPARLKFLKTEKTEAAAISDIIEKLALSHPDISFKFKNAGSVKLSTTGNGRLKDAIYAVYGRDITNRLLEVDETTDVLSVKGFIGDPSITRGNRNMETYFINGRYIKNKVLDSAIEEGYKGWLMKGSFPFTVFDVRIEPELIDVNVHPSKMEIRFFDNQEVFYAVSRIISHKLQEWELIPEVVPGKLDTSQDHAEPTANDAPEPFETKRTMEFIRKYTSQEKPAAGFLREAPRYKTGSPKMETSIPGPVMEPSFEAGIDSTLSDQNELPGEITELKPETNFYSAHKDLSAGITETKQETLFSDAFLSEKARVNHRLVGQIFDTYWIVEYGDQLYMIDQHAAHEKVKYEEFMKKLRDGEHYAQNILPVLILSLDHSQEEALLKYKEQFSQLGFEIEHYGARDYAVSALPMDLYDLNNQEAFLFMLDELAELKGYFSPESLLDKVATASCKAAVKGGSRISFAEADTLINKLLELDNPYHCPHGRPTIISMSKTEIERKFKRLV